MNMLHVSIIAFFLVGVNLQTVSIDSDSDFETFVDQVLGVINGSDTYILPVDNGAYFNESESSDPTDFGGYDFIIIGGGTAGGVLANRLTEENFTVLIVEAGKEVPALTAVSLPLALGSYLFNSDYNWGYNTTPQSQACLGATNQQCFYPRGKALGGSSAINGGAYVRGNKEDYDNWEALGNAGWSYDDVLPYFKKAELARFVVDIDEIYHGFDGPQCIDVAEDTPNLTNYLISAYEELGLTELDYNGENQVGFSRMQFFLDNITRAGSAHAYIRPVLNRSNLFVTLESLVTKILISSKTAYGVEFVKNGTTYVANASKEVILSAGAINSPQVLMLSGIGPEAELTKHDIEVIADLPVGQYLYDHLVYGGLNYRTNETYSNNTVEQNLYLWRDGHLPLIAGRNLVSFFKYEGTNDSRPDIELYNIFYNADVLNFNEEYTTSFETANAVTDFTIMIVLLHPKSVGNVTLQSSDPKDYPLINPNYLSDESDLETMYNGVQSALSLNNTETFQNWGAHFFNIPLPTCEEFEALSKDWWYCGFRSLAATLYHPIGTTRMGTSSNDSVVDSDLKVHGIENLRVVDAGVMPTTISGHTNAATVMLAEKIADVIKAEYAV